MIIADTSGLLAFFNSAEPQHDAVREVVENGEDPLVVSPFVIAELDYLVSQRVGIDAELTVLRELAGGAWELPAFSDVDISEMANVIEQYKDQEIGIADASIIRLCQRYETQSVLTLDHRHFGVFRLKGKKFQLLP